ncbi:MAG: hypothetical protein HYY22_09115 [Thaumarchaeota archaeon]|nr:hypothetical protein [Nitrososphaerota archaeon]
MHSYHRPLEVYARDVALEIAKNPPEGVIVRESPRKRSFGRLTTQYNAAWILDLHSDPYQTPAAPEDLKHPYLPLVLIEYGEKWKGTLHELAQKKPDILLDKPFTQEGEFVRNVIEKHLRERYTVERGVVGNITYGGAVLPYVKTRSNPHFIRMGLLWYRTKEFGVQLVNGLAQHLLCYPL